MNTEDRKLVVVVTESALESMLVKDVMALGAYRYTICDVRGEGHHGPRDGAWKADRNIRMEIVCDAAAARAILEHVSVRYSPHYMTSVFVADVGVLDTDRR